MTSEKRIDLVLFIDRKDFELSVKKSLSRFYYNTAVCTRGAFLYNSVMLKNYLWIFFISMVPLIELRGAIPVSQALQMPIVSSYIVCIIGNMLPVPIIYLFARKFLEWGQDKKVIGGMCRFFLTKGAAAGEKMQEKAGRGIFLALMLFVAIPLPGTGAWTGTLGASLLDMKFKDTIIAVMLGVLIAGLIMMAVSLGLFTALFAAMGK